MNACGSANLDAVWVGNVMAQSMHRDIEPLFVHLAAFRSNGNWNVTCFCGVHSLDQYMNSCATLASFLGAGHTPEST